jgi:hypothetical protein
MGGQFGTHTPPSSPLIYKSFTLSVHCKVAVQSAIAYMFWTDNSVLKLTIILHYGLCTHKYENCHPLLHSFNEINAWSHMVYISTYLFLENLTLSFLDFSWKYIFPPYQIIRRFRLLEQSGKTSYNSVKGSTPFYFFLEKACCPLVPLTHSQNRSRVWLTYSFGAQPSSIS